MLAISSSDGLAYAENVITSGNSFYVYQIVSEYEIREEYTISIDARLAIRSGATTTQCIFKVLKWRLIYYVVVHILDHLIVQLLVDSIRNIQTNLLVHNPLCPCLLPVRDKYEHARSI